MILLLFQTGLRISEALNLTVGHLSRQPGALEILGKGRKLRLVACPAPLFHRLKAYAFDRGLGSGDRLFPVGRERAWQIIGAAAGQAGLGKRVYPHLFVHSGAIERLRQTGNPRALQLHLGHASPLMTLRYLSTITAEEALASTRRSASMTEAAALHLPWWRPATNAGSWCLQQSHQFRVWMDPFVNLRVPLIFDLRMDPFERASIDSNSYYEWMELIAQIIGVATQDYAGRMIVSFKEFPPRQKPASFNLDQVMQTLTDRKD